MADDSKRKRGLMWWVDRWRRSSAFIDMTLSEQGAYRNLLDEQRLRGGQIPNDERTLARACGDPLEWPNVRDKVLRHFEVSPDGKWLSNRTATEVNAVTDAVSEKRAEAGREGMEAVERGPGGRFAGKATGKGTGKPTGNTTGKPPAEDTGKPDGQTTGIRYPVSGAVSGTGSGAESDQPADSRGRVRRANPLVGERRDPLEREWMELVRWIAATTGEPQEQVAPPFKGRSVLNPADLGDDRLLRDLIDLRRRKADIEAQKRAPPPPDPAVERAWWDQVDTLATEFVRWYGENPEAGHQHGRTGVHAVAFGHWPRRKDIPPAPRDRVLKAALKLLEKRRAG